MTGGVQKSGRGGGGAGRGGAGGKRNAYAMQNSSHVSSSGGGGGRRLSMGGSGLRGSNLQAPAPVQSAATDETFSLVACKPLSFAATLRLPPDLLEEIKRVESQGGAAKIKFDSNSSSHSGNVIDVGGKIFRFTWSHEASHLCDIYEEPSNHEDSNGLLIESGCPYRKLNVVRKLDESTKNHVKMRSVEAERMNKARKTVVLDPSNPSMKNQIRAIAAAEAPWKNLPKNKKESPYKKRKFETNQAGGPPKVVHRAGFPTSTSAKGRPSSSPLSSPPVQSISLVSPSVAEYPNNTPANTGAATPVNATAEDIATKPERDTLGKTFPQVPEIVGRRFNESLATSDLQSMLTSLLRDNSHGMSLKALEKAVGDVHPSSSRKIEPILKKIATYQAPGRYILNMESEQGHLKRCSQSRSSPEGGDGLQIYVTRENNDDLASQKLVASEEKSPDPHVEEKVTLDSLFGEDVDLVENIDISQNSPDHMGEKNSEGHADRSSDSGSDSYSDSSDSGSGSSRSRSPAGSGSGSSSDSDSDSSNSKEGSDVDVDIISDDENEPKHAIQGSVQGGHTFLDQFRTPDDRLMNNGAVERMDDQQSEDIDIEGDQDDIDVGTALDLSSYAEAKSTAEFRSTLPNQEEHQEHWTADMSGEPEQLVAVDMEQDNQDRSQTSKGKYKKSPRLKKNAVASDHGKRAKGASSAESPASWSDELLFAESPHKPPDKLDEDQYKESNLEIEDRSDRVHNSNLASQRGDHQDPGKMAVEPEQSGSKPSLSSHDLESQDRSSKDLWSDNNVLEASVKQKKKMDRDAQDGKGKSYEKANRRANYSASRNKNAQLNLLPRKQPDQVKKLNIEPDAGLYQQDGSRADVGRFPSITGRDNVLRRELSDLELGELREPVPMEIVGNDNQFETQGSFKQFDTKVGTAALNINMNKGCPANKIDLIQSSSDKGVRNGSSRVSALFHDQVLESNMEGYGETHKKAHTKRQNDSKNENVSISGKGTNSQKSIPSAKGILIVRDASPNDGHNDNHRSESSSDENSSFSKYEKEKPDLKEPVKDLMQYKEYVNEYTEKYTIYCSLNKVLENYRNEFHKMGKDLDSAKSKDMTKYYRVLRRLRESYHQHGEKHKRLTKIFVVLHEELKHLKQRIKDFASAYNKD